MLTIGALALTLGTVALVGFVLRDPFGVRAIHRSFYIAANVLAVVLAATVAWALLAASGISWARRYESVPTILSIISLFTLAWGELGVFMLYLWRLLERSNRDRH